MRRGHRSRLSPLPQTGEGRAAQRVAHVLTSRRGQQYKARRVRRGKVFQRMDNHIHITPYQCGFLLGAESRPTADSGHARQERLTVLVAPFQDHAVRENGVRKSFAQGTQIFAHLSLGKIARARADEVLNHGDRPTLRA